MNVLSSSSVESILEIGNLMIEAKTELSKDEYQEFLTQTKYSNNSSSVRKWEVIGKAYLRLQPISNKLPPNWSTLYKLASLDVNQFDALEQLDIFNPSLTAKEIDAELNKSNPKKPCIQLIIEIDCDQTLAKCIQDIVMQIENEILTQFMTLKLSTDLKELLNSITHSESLPSQIA